MFKQAALAAIVFAALAGSASAQSTNPNVGPGNPTDRMSVITRGSSATYMSFGVPTQYASQAQTDRARTKATPKEWKRAKQAAFLINSNNCVDAYKLAVAEQDDRLASGVKEVCSVEPHS
jgi:hypothetical protein